MIIIKGRQRSIQLEFARGTASIIVILHHFVLAFIPHLKRPVWELGLLYTPLYTLVNGDGAVIYFFMLSGFVLSAGFYRDFSKIKLIMSVMKRFPRLLVPAGASIFLGYLVTKYLFPLHQSAAALSDSPWLAGFGLANLPTNFQPSLLDAARQSMIVLLVPNQYYYNSNLWTMINEFYGSIIVFALVFALHLSFTRNKIVATLMHVSAIFIFAIIHNSFVPFVVGSYLAYICSKDLLTIRVGPTQTRVLLAVAWLGFSSANPIAWTSSSLCVMIVLLGNKTIAASLSGPIGAWLGSISFPIYLVHTIVIVSLSSFVFTALSRAGVAQAAILLPTLAVTLSASLVLALPFVILDRNWVSWLNKFAYLAIERAGYAHLSRRGQ